MGKLQQFYDKRYEKGLCIYCGKNPYDEGMKTCGACRRKKKNNSPLVNVEGDMITASGEVKPIDDVLNSTQFLMCDK